MLHRWNPSELKMAAGLNFEKRNENAVELQRQFRREFQLEMSLELTELFRRSYEKRSGRPPQTSTACGCRWSFIVWNLSSALSSFVGLVDHKSSHTKRPRATHHARSPLLCGHTCTLAAAAGPCRWASESSAWAPSSASPAPPRDCQGPRSAPPGAPWPRRLSVAAGFVWGTVCCRPCCATPWEPCRGGTSGAWARRRTWLVPGPDLRTEDTVKVSKVYELVQPVNSTFKFQGRALDSHSMDCACFFITRHNVYANRLRVATSSETLRQTFCHAFAAAMKISNCMEKKIPSTYSSLAPVGKYSKVYWASLLNDSMKKKDWRQKS